VNRYTGETRPPRQSPNTADAEVDAGDSDEPLRGAKQTTVIKYGGNAMTDRILTERILRAVAKLHAGRNQVVLVHGGGPFIRELLDELGHESEFIGGHRRTDGCTIKYVSMVLCGQVNGEIVSLLNGNGVRAVGISGRDAGLARAVPRLHTVSSNSEQTAVDLGFVGDIRGLDTSLVSDLLKHGYLPVVSPISSGPENADYNVNADMFAGHLASALQADEYLVLTDVDGIFRHKDDPSSLISELRSDSVPDLLGSVITGGMIPKVQSSLIAVNGGVRLARIVNGTDPSNLLPQRGSKSRGTTIRSR